MPAERVKRWLMKRVKMKKMKEKKEEEEKEGKRGNADLKKERKTTTRGEWDGYTVLTRPLLVSFILNYNGLALLVRGKQRTRPDVLGTMWPTAVSAVAHVQ